MHTSPSIDFMLATILWSDIIIFIYFIDEETKTERGDMTCSVVTPSHSWKVVQSEFKPKSSEFLDPYS